MGLFGKDKGTEPAGGGTYDDLMSMDQPPDQQPADAQQEQGGFAPPVQFVEQLGSLSRRMKLLEERLANVSKRIQLSDHNIIEGSKKIHTEIRTTNEEVEDLKGAMREMKEKIALIIQEFKNVPSKEDVKVLEKYVTLWNPMEFITRKQAEKIVTEIVEDQLEK